MAVTADSNNGGDARWTPRRIVTGTDAQGKSRIASDNRSPEPLDVWGPGSATFYNVWRTDPAAHVPHIMGDTDPAAGFTDMTQIFPECGGSHMTISLWPANYPPEETMPAWMHSTDSVEYILIVSGEMTCFFDSGEKVTLAAGDCLIQNGTAHAWRNESARDCVMAAISIGAKRA